MQVACGKYLVNDNIWHPKKHHFGEIFFPWYPSANTRILLLVTHSFKSTQLDTYFIFCILHYIRGNKMFAAFDYHVYSKIFFLYWNWFLQVWTSSKINQKNLLNVTLGYRLLENCECVQIVSIISILHVCSSMRVQNESFSSLTPRPNL